MTIGTIEKPFKIARNGTPSAMNTLFLSHDRPIFTWITYMAPSLETELTSCRVNPISPHYSIYMVVIGNKGVETTLLPVAKRSHFDVLDDLINADAIILHSLIDRLNLIFLVNPFDNCRRRIGKYYAGQMVQHKSAFKSMPIDWFSLARLIRSECW